MANLHLTNSTAANVSIVGHRGTPSLTIGHVAGHTTALIDVFDVIGNVTLIDSLKTFVTAATLVIRYGGATGTILTSADLEDFKTGNPFNVDLNNITVKIAGFNLKDTATELSVTLPGDGTRRFRAQKFYFICKTANTLTGDATFDCGSTSTGTDLINGSTLTGLTDVNELFRIDVAVTAALTIADNSTLYAHVKAADSGTSGTMDFYVKGVIL